MAFNFSPKIITDNLILYLDAANTKSYPGSGTVWNDLSRSQNNGTLVNGPTFNSGSNGSIVFDGVNDRIDISPTNFNLSEVSINMWFITNDISSDFLRLIHKADTTGTTRGFIIANSATNGKLIFGYQSNYTTGELLRRSTNLISTSVWYNIAMTYNSSGGIKIYFNGIEDIGEIATSPDTGWLSTTGNLFSIGSRAGGPLYFNGNIAQVSIYNRTLSPQEIQQNYNATRQRFGV
jgi:hypothetical protein